MSDYPIGSARLCQDSYPQVSLDKKDVWVYTSQQYKKEVWFEKSSHFLKHIVRL